MRAEGGAQVQVPNDCYDQRCFAAMFFFLYIFLKLQGNKHGPFKTAWYLLCSQVVSYLLTENWTASYSLLTRPLASKTYLFM